MENLRTEPRNDVFLYLDIKDSHTEELYGKLVDISPKGMRIMSEAPKTVGEKAHVFIQMPKDYYQDNFKDIKLVCRWCRPGPVDGIYDSGFSITNMGENINIDDVIRYLTLPSFYNDFLVDE